MSSDTRVAASAKIRSLRRWGGSLLGNYVRIALRKMRRQKAYSFITVAGLAVGLASFIAEKRTKEIGIRKILGASTRGLVLMQSREFLVWVLAANVIAWPVAYLAVGRWLQGFAYRVSPGILPALLAATLSLLVAFLSVAFKVVRAATANPTESLRYE